MDQSSNVWKIIIYNEFGQNYCCRSWNVSFFIFNVNIFRFHHHECSSNWARGNGCWNRLSFVTARDFVDSNSFVVVCCHHRRRRRCFIYFWLSPTILTVSIFCCLFWFSLTSKFDIDTQTHILAMLTLSNDHENQHKFSMILFFECWQTNEVAQTVPIFLIIFSVFILVFDFLTNQNTFRCSFAAYGRRRLQFK